ncbi:MAG TPA: glycosyltransferase [Pyrinomonadaceae bacterium]|nr:glycosyltransferase [Pyrinomonadaceae bacterium]
MKILIDGQTLLTADINRGIGKYFINTIENILQYDFTNDFYLTGSPATNLSFFSPWAREKLQVLENEAYNTRTSSNGNSDLIYSDALANDIERLGVSVYWSPNGLMDNVVLPARQTTSCTYAVTIFDLIPLVMKDHFEKHWPPSMLSSYKNKLKRVAADFDLFLHISHHTRADFVRELPVADKRHVVTQLAADNSFRPLPFPVTAAADYIIYPGGFDPRKNMERAIEAFARLHAKYGSDDGIGNTQLCIVCSSDQAGETQLLNLAKKLGVGGKVRLTGFVEESLLVETYQRARCLFFPSLYEGFGLPVVEGLACGLPVAASNSSSIPEVGSDLAVYFDPYDVEAMADALREALQAPVDVESKLKRYEYSRSFSWKKTALTTLDALTNFEAIKIEEPAVAETRDPDFIDVRQRMQELSLDELCETAEEFYARIDNFDYLHAKPLAAVNETPELLINFSQVVHGLRLLPEMTIVDFGAGACWTSRFLSQLGLRVIAVDVSASALKIGEELYRRYAPVGDQPPARFLRFDGRSLDLADESVDRISCWDAFHHVPNPGEVLKEMARVLKPGGIAGFAEPGPEHSKSPQSQFEMRTNRLIENDVDLAAIWRDAEAAGFTDLRVALFNPEPTLLPLTQFEACLSGEDTAEQYVTQTREQMRHRRVFFLFKGESQDVRDSRQREGLRADLSVEAESTTGKAGESLTLKVVATNSGSNAWLLRESRVGLVRFGIHLFTADAKLIDLDYYRQTLPGEKREMMPGETVEFTAEVPLPAATGTYVLQCDLVSESVCWFEHNGSATVKFTVDVS